MPAMPDLVRYISDAIRHSIGFQAECFRCHHVQVLDMRALAEHCGPEKSIRWLRRKLKCNRCGAKHGELELWPIRQPPAGPIGGAFGGAYDDAAEIPRRLEALSGPIQGRKNGRR